MDAHCRISTVHYKASPHVVEILPRPRGANLRHTMHKHLDRICDYHAEEGLAGIVIVGWGFNGYWSRSSRIHRDSFVGQTLMPKFVESILSRDTMEDVIHDTIRIL